MSKDHPALDQIAKALQTQASTTINIRTGTCLSGTNRATGVVTVALDNDPKSTPVSAISVAGLVQIGARVAMLAYPPRGLLVVGQIGGLPALQFMESHDYTDQATYTSATATLGSPTVGFTFVAPTSGSILLEVSPVFELAGTNAGAVLGARGHIFAQVRTGNVIGSGALFQDGDGDKGPLVLAENQKIAAAATVTAFGMGSGYSPVVGLTPNQTYNASMWYRLEAAAATYSIFVTSRRLTGLLVT